MLEIKQVYSTTAYDKFLAWRKERFDRREKFTNVYKNGVRALCGWREGNMPLATSMDGLREIMAFLTAMNRRQNIFIADKAAFLMRIQNANMAIQFDRPCFEIFGSMRIHVMRMARMRAKLSSVVTKSGRSRLAGLPNCI